MKGKTKKAGKPDQEHRKQKNKNTEIKKNEDIKSRETRKQANK